jgi:hypothetical protein
MPRVSIEHYRVVIKRSKFIPKQFNVGVKSAPKDCYLPNIINYPYDQLGAPQIAIRGNKGTFKSNNLNFFLALLAAKNVKVIAIADDAFEYRHFAAHQYLHAETNEMTPYELDVWIPKNYEFKTKSTTNPLWKYRSNVQRCDYKNIDNILDSLENHKLSIIYESCFDDAGKLKLLDDIYMYCAENVSPSNVYLIVHHELQSLLPESPTDDIYKLSIQIAKRFGRSRKDRVGLLASFHMSNEVFYKVCNKMRFICEKKPTNSNSLSKAEKDAQKQKRTSMNIAECGYWATHDLGYFPELPDWFRLVPQRKKLKYPSLEFPKKKDKTKVEMDKTNLDILRLRAQGKTYAEISSIIGMPSRTIWSRCERMGVTN